MKRRLFTLAVVYWLVVIVIAHLVAPPGYVWTQNTISELASQGHCYKWIMQFGLSGFGLLIVVAVLQSCQRAGKVIYHLLPVALYGLAIFMSGIYCAAPLDLSAAYSENEASLHSVFATLAGLSLSLAILWRIFSATTVQERRLHLLFLIAVMGFSAVFGLAENHVIDIGKGIVQRLLYLSGFGWLIYQESLSVRNDIDKRYSLAASPINTMN